MAGLRAEETLRERGHRLTPESLRDLMVQAGSTQDEADDAYCRRVLETERE
jgi:hypothetical protein